MHGRGGRASRRRLTANSSTGLPTASSSRTFAGTSSTTRIRGWGPCSARHLTGAGEGSAQPSRLLPDREGEAEGAAVAGGAFDPEAAAVELDELPGEGEAESGAFGPLAVR